MRFVVLGSGTALPDADRGPAGFAVQHGACVWLVDGGSGTVQRLARAGFDARDLTGGVLSHRHPDHSGGLPGVLFAQVVGGRQHPYPLWGGEGLAGFVRAVQAAWPGMLDAPVDVRELSLEVPSRADLGEGLTLRTAPANHGAGALHLRFEADGVAVVFSGDTGVSPGLTALTRGADLLVTECGRPPSAEPGGHLRPQDVAALARDARPHEVWLTHLYPDTDPDQALARVAATGVPTRRAADGDAWPDVSAR